LTNLGFEEALAAVGTQELICPLACVFYQSYLKNKDVKKVDFE